VSDYLDQEDLVHLLEGMTRKYEKEHAQLKATRLKLSQLRNRILRMKGIIEYQRERIIQLHSLDRERNHIKSV
jgi:hypothetical protein